MSPSSEPAFRVTSRMVLAIALPMTLAQVTIPLVGVVNMGVVGRTGDAAAIGGIALGALAFDFLFSTFSFLRAGTTALTAQALGANDAREQRAVLLRALLLSFAIGLGLLVLQRPLILGFLAAIHPGEAATAATRAYFDIRVYSVPFGLANAALFGWVLGLGRAGLGLGLISLLNGLNIGLALLLGVWFGLGIEGVAWSTILAEATTLAVALLILTPRLRAGPLPDRAELLDAAAFGRLMLLNRDLMIRSVVLLTGFAGFSAVGARLGDATLAANAVLMNVFLVGAFFLDGLATAAEQLVGRAFGAACRIAFDDAVRLSVTWGFAVSLFASTVLLFAGPAGIDLLAADPEVRALARKFLPYAAATPLLAVLAFEMDGVFIGATWSRDMRNMMLLSAAVFALLLVLLVPSYGNHGLWVALLVFLTLRGATLALRLGVRTRRARGATLFARS